MSTVGNVGVIFKIPLLNSPGVYIDRTENQLLVVMNTFANPGRLNKDSAVGSGADFPDEDELIKVPNMFWFQPIPTLNY